MGSTILYYYPIWMVKLIGITILYYYVFIGNIRTIG